MFLIALFNEQLSMLSTTRVATSIRSCYESQPYVRGHRLIGNHLVNYYRDIMITGNLKTLPGLPRPGPDLLATLTTALASL